MYALGRGVRRCPGHHTFPAHFLAVGSYPCPPCEWLTLMRIVNIGDVPPIDNLFPPRPEPVLQKPGEEGPSRPVPVATGAGFFTPEAGSAGNLFHDWKPGLKAMDAAAGPRDSMLVIQYPIINVTLTYILIEARPPTPRSTASRHFRSPCARAGLNQPTWRFNLQLCVPFLQPMRRAQ